MSLISTEVEVMLKGKNIEWYENKGYDIPKINDKHHKGKKVVPNGTTIKVNVSDLSLGSNVKVKYRCDCCGEEYETKWASYNKCIKEDGKFYCRVCATKLYGGERARLSQVKNSTSFKQWCLDNNRLDIIERWDYDLNKYEPDKIGCGSHLTVWFKCPNGTHKSEPKKIYLITKGWEKSIACNACNSIGQYLINEYGENALETYWSNKNTIDAFEVSYGSDTKVWLNCQNCKNDKKVRFADFIRYGFSCPKCSDGISYPNKFAFNLLDQLHIDFINEYSPDWIKPKRYDFYFEINNDKYILEMDGGLGHGNKNNLSGKTEEESKAIDDYKDKLAKEHGIEVIRIDCEKSELEYIKNNIIRSELAKLFNLSKIEWNKCDEYACNSLIRIVCDQWNEGVTNATKISNITKIGNKTVVRYLNHGAKLGWCDYNGKEELKKNFINLSKKVYCFELDRIFDSTMEVERELGIFNSNISACCLGKKNHATAGGYHWIYYEDYMANLDSSQCSV